MAGERQRASNEPDPVLRRTPPIVLTLQQRARIRERLAAAEQPADLAAEYGVPIRAIRSCR